MERMKTFEIHTLGCKLNFSESSEITRLLTEQGWVISKEPAVIIVNSCAVTAVAEKKTRNLVSKLHRENPDSKIVVVGCYAALRADEILQWPGVVKTFGDADKLNIVPFLLNQVPPATPYFFSTFSSNDRTRSFLKIQDGCDYHCTYCTVWKARGDSRSDTIEHVLSQLDKIVCRGIKEVNLTGVNIGDFGKSQGTDLYHLLKAIDERNYPLRVRISSIEPNLLTDEIIDLTAQSNVIMPHFHIPLQAANDRILGLMHRRYQRALYASKVERIKRQIPYACIAMDIIAGFPTETDAEFVDSLRFLNDIPISYAHVFTYSQRPGTPAMTMVPQVHPKVKHERTRQLMALSDRKKDFFYHQHIGESRPVLLEAGSKKQWMFGFTDNYIKIKLPFQLNKINTIEWVTIQEDMLVFKDGEIKE